MAIAWAEDASIILTLIVLEAVLSFDNAAILAALSRKLPAGEYRKKALNYGLLIAYILRILAILFVLVLIREPWFLTIGGLYLIFLFARHMLHLFTVHRGSAKQQKEKEKSVSNKPPFLTRIGMPPFTAVIVQIGFVDLAFALDQVVAAVGFTRERWLIVIAATIGLISLRILAPYISRLMDWLPLLEHIAYVAVGFVGVLLVLEHPIVFSAHYELAKPIKVGITLGMFLIPILIKLLFNVPKSHPGEHRAIEQAMPPVELQMPKTPGKP